MIKDFDNFVTELFKENKNLKSINFKHCTHNLELTEEFLYKNKDTLQNLDLLSLPDNNAHFEDWKAFCRFLYILIGNKSVNFSQNPLFKLQLFHDFSLD